MLEVYHRFCYLCLLSDKLLGLEFQYHLLFRRAQWLKIAVDIAGVMVLSALFTPLWLRLLCGYVYILLDQCFIVRNVWERNFSGFR
jgi:hypothetical protein